MYKLTWMHDWVNFCAQSGLDKRCPRISDIHLVWGPCVKAERNIIKIQYFHSIACGEHSACRKMVLSASRRMVGCAILFQHFLDQH